MEYRFYEVPEKCPVLALLGEKWVQNYGYQIDYLHFHNMMEIGVCYYGEGTIVLEDKEIVTPSYHVLFFPTSKPAEPATHLFPSYAWKQKNCRKSFSFKISFDSFLSSDRIFYHASFF